MDMQNYLEVLDFFHELIGLCLITTLSRWMNEMLESLFIHSSLVGSQVLWRRKD